MLWDTGSACVFQVAHEMFQCIRALPQGAAPYITCRSKPEEKTRKPCEKKRNDEEKERKTKETNRKYEERERKNEEKNEGGAGPRSREGK